MVVTEVHSMLWGTKLLTLGGQAAELSASHSRHAVGSRQYWHSSGVRTSTIITLASWARCHRASREARGSVTVWHSSRARIIVAGQPARLWKLDYQASREARGNVNGFFFWHTWLDRQVLQYQCSNRAKTSPGWHSFYYILSYIPSIVAIYFLAIIR